jgi:hypothetical protein
MTAIMDFEYDKVSELVAKYLVYDKERKEFIIPEDAPKEVHEAYKRRLELDEKYKED